jgi:hypothetical protein
MTAAIGRRRALQLLAGVGALALGANPGLAHRARIDRLIVEAQAQGDISQRIDFISRALLGTAYRGYTLIGGPRAPEKFVVRDDAFDCVTFCETVLAAAMARDAGAFEPALRNIRYHDGIVAWRERNHYFFEWGEHNIENNTCRAVALDGAVEIDKTVYWHRALGKRRFAMRVIPRDVFMDNRALLRTGDIVGFVTQRPNLDYFHIGFVAFGDGGEFLLRHAARSRDRVLDERMDKFVAVNHVRYVTLLRPLEPKVAAGSMNYAAAALAPVVTAVL